MTISYRNLTDAHKTNISQQRLLELEGELYRLDLDIRLAEATGIDTPQLAEGRTQKDLLIKQIATLTSWLTPTPETVTGDLVPANGQEHVVL